MAYIGIEVGDNAIYWHRSGDNDTDWHRSGG